MATPQHAKHESSTYLGKSLLVLGFLALAADLAVLAQPLDRLAAKLSDGLFSLVPTIGLSFADALRAVAFHQIDYFSLVSRILVLFTATLAVVVGAALLRSPSARSAHSDLLQAPSFREREANNG